MMKFNKPQQRARIDRWKFRQMWERGDAVDLIMIECGFASVDGVYHLRERMKLTKRHTGDPFKYSRDRARQ